MTEKINQSSDKIRDWTNNYSSTLDQSLQEILLDTTEINSWLFLGGHQVQGSLNSIQTARTFVGHFEEYIRWQKQDATIESRKRYVTNGGRQEQAIAESLASFDRIVATYSPRIVSYLVSDEDLLKQVDPTRSDMHFGMQAGLLTNTDFSIQTDELEIFIEGLTDLIGKTLALRNETGIAVIQLPYRTRDENLNRIKQVYRHHVIELVNNWSEAEKARIILVDHFNRSYDGSFLNGLAANNDLNPRGHLLIAKQFIKVIFGGQADVLHYSHLNRFMIKNSNHPLTWPTATQAHPLSQAVQDLVENKGSLIWLFMGDSITHGALHTVGYDSVPQLFEKYLMSDLNRPQDMVYNSAISGATADTTLADWRDRFSIFKADVVVMMIGTNDTKHVSVEVFQENLEEILTYYQEAEIPVVIRSLLPYYNFGHEEFVDKTKEFYHITKRVAEKFEVIFVDQFLQFEEAMTNYPYLINPEFSFFNDGLHPANLGQLLMFKELIKTLSLSNDYAQALTWNYALPLEEKVLTAEIPFNKYEQHIRLAAEDLKALVDEEISDVIIQLASDGQNFEAKLDDKTIIPAEMFKGTLKVCLYAKNAAIVYVVSNAVGSGY